MTSKIGFKLRGSQINQGIHLKIICVTVRVGSFWFSLQRALHFLVIPVDLVVTSDLLVKLYRHLKFHEELASIDEVSRTIHPTNTTTVSIHYVFAYFNYCFREYDSESSLGFVGNTLIPKKSRFIVITQITDTTKASTPENNELVNLLGSKGYLLSVTEENLLGLLMFHSVVVHTCASRNIETSSLLMRVRNKSRNLPINNI